MRYGMIKAATSIEISHTNLYNYMQQHMNKDFITGKVQVQFLDNIDPILDYEYYDRLILLSLCSENDKKASVIIIIIF